MAKTRRRTARGKRGKAGIHHKDTKDRKKVSISVPLGQIDPVAYCARHVDISQLTPVQARTLKQVLAALSGRHEQLASGRHVENGADVVRWLLEQIAEQAAQNTPEVSEAGSC